MVLLNYVAPAPLLEPLVPRGTELDRWEGQPLLSLVGLLFSDTRLCGVPVPGHRSFEEVNLRFYVRRRAEDGSTRRAVVFVRELVPRRLVAAVARLTYNEPYLAVPMAHATDVDVRRGGRASYRWRFRGETYTLDAEVEGPARVLEPGSEAEFVTEHYWGYTRQRDGGTLEYQVEHPRWPVWTPIRARFGGDAVPLYGEALGRVLGTRPRSAFVAPGSPVAVRSGRRVA